MEDFQIRINELRRKEPAALTESDLEFLKARQSYLTGEERAKFGLEEAPKQPADEQDSEEPEKPVKKGKKQPADEQAE